MIETPFMFQFQKGKPNHGLSLNKNKLTSDWENIIAYWEESELREALANKCNSLQKQLRVYGGGSNVTPGNLCNFLPSFKLVNY